MTSLKNYGSEKTAPISIRQKNITIRNILALVMHSSSFLVLGHSYTDVDCISSMVAISLLLKKFNKHVSIYLQDRFPSSVKFFKNICEYNEIMLFVGNTEDLKRPDVIIILDTPKPEMIAMDDKILSFFLQKNIPKIEIDHHFSSDARHSGDEPYQLTLRASSSAEIIAIICKKLSSHTQVLEKHGICEIYSRNIVMAMVTGMLGDAKMGEYLASKRDRSFFHYFLNKFDRLLQEYHYKGSKNIKNVDEALLLLEQMTEEESILYDIMEKYVTKMDKLALLLLDEASSLKLQAEADNFLTFLDVLRTMTGKLSDSPNLASISCFYYPLSISSFVEFRVRASESIRGIDFRSLIEEMEVPEGNGGGHAGAICFKVDRALITDINEYTKKLIAKVEKKITSLVSK